MCLRLLPSEYLDISYVGAAKYVMEKKLKRRTVLFVLRHPRHTYPHACKHPHILYTQFPVFSYSTLTLRKKCPLCFRKLCNCEFASCFVLQVLRETFPHHTFLMNGLIQGVKVRLRIWLTSGLFDCWFHIWVTLTPCAEGWWFPGDSSSVWFEIEWCLADFAGL